jgi:amino acid transporter
LRPGAIGFAAALAIGMASTAPAYSLAATLGLVSKELGPASTAVPAVLLIAFLPILCIAVAFDRLNRVDADCGTTFTWVTRSMGPWMGWMAGWATLSSGTLVMASLAQVSGIYTFRLLGMDALAESRVAVALAGTAWVVLMTWICARGIESAARTQYLLLGLELIALIVFTVAALATATGPGAPADALKPAASWFNPGTVESSSAFAGAVLASIFLYWGWESALSMNEETRNSTRTPGRAGLASVVILLLIYVLVAAAAQSVHGPAFLAGHADDVFSALARDLLSPPWDRLLILGVLTSAVAAAQTTVIPTARSVLSMASAGALPAALASIHPRFQTPHVATWVLGAVSCAWFVALSFWSKDVLADSILSTALLVAFTYALTGYACPLVYRRIGIFSWKNVLVLAALPLLGAVALTWAFVESCVSLAEPASAGLVLGVGVPLLTGISLLLVGAVIMAARFCVNPSFFRPVEDAASWPAERAP